MYTIGEFAKKANVTLRTLRYYDKIDLLKPNGYKESGHRLYTEKDFAKLQKILTLKFIGLSLQHIKDILEYDTKDSDFIKSLEIQKNIIEGKINHLHMVVNAIDETLETVQNNDLDWDKFVKIINVINMDKEWIEQYKNASNLRARIKIHENYSTNKYDWMRWFFEKLDISPHCDILEVGCGDASLWVKNLDRIKKGWKITLTDFSKGMIEDAIKNLHRNKNRFNFKVVDAHNIPFKDNSFDVVIANHMLYHLSDINKAISEIHRVLKPNGVIFASTVGKNHMKELREIIKRFQCEDITTRSFEAVENFQLENGHKRLSKWFKNIEVKRYDDNLIVTEAEPLIDYVFSMPDNSKNSLNLKRREEFECFIKEEIKKNGSIFITKDTGFFKAIK